MKSSIRELTRTDSRVWGDVPCETSELEFAHGNVIDVLLVEFYENFARAAAGNGRLICPGPEARDVVELANAVLLSGSEGRELKLPLDRAAYREFIEGKIKPAVTASK